MNDYENAILARQEYSGDDCLSCEFRGGMCNGQCTEIHVIYNPNLEALKCFTNYYRICSKLKTE